MTATATKCPPILARNRYRQVFDFETMAIIVNYINMKQLILFSLFLIGLSKISFAQIVYIPDSIFKNYLVSIPQLNSNFDEEIQFSEAMVYTNTINVQWFGIHDLTGIEAFTSITELNCGNNFLQNLNISNNTALQHLYCSSNQLTNLDVSANSALTELSCDYNQLTSLNITSNPAIYVLYCSLNFLTNLDVSANPALIELHCENNLLNSLNVSANTALQRLWCSDNLLTDLDVSTNTSLQELYVNNNQLNNLDVSANSALSLLFCNNTHLTSLNVKNGNNINIPNWLFVATNNPALSCIQVDNAAWSTANWTYIDTCANFSENCISNSEQFVLETYLNIFPNPNNGDFYLNCDLTEKSQLIILNILGETVYSHYINSIKTEINLTNKSKGIYFYQLQNNGKTTKNGIIIID